MKLVPGWHWPQGAQLRYCFKVAVATLLGYLLSLGGSEAAVYGAMSAALIVGASRGEDVSTSANRVRGTLAGMLVGIAMTYAALPPALSVAIGIGSTAYLCIAFGWGVPAARVGAALCAVMVLIHGQDAVDYSVIRVGNTLIGIIAGLAVSYLVLPVRGREAVMQAADTSLAAAGDLLAQLGIAIEPLPATFHVAMLDRVVELEKAMRDGRHEFGGQTGALLETVRHVGLVCAGTLTAAIAHSDLCASPHAMTAAAPLLANAARLSARARVPSYDTTIAAQISTLVVSDMSDLSGADAVALQGLALGLRKIEFSLGIIGR
jgi:uncharacterized membrane protein YccC